MRSGSGENTQPERFRRPSMQRVELPAPWMCAPQRFRNAARSAISGSRAAPRSTVVPLAQAAASTSVSVAPTLGKRRVISAPCRPDGAVSTSRPGPASHSTAPIWRSPARCRSMGRAPMLHPPGRLVSARPSFASSGAQKRMDARICSAVCPGRLLFCGVPETRISSPSHRAAQPAPRKSARLAATSERRGTARRRTSPQSIDAASSGSTLFFAAGMRTAPFSGRPPITTIRFSINAAPISQKIPHGMRNEGCMCIGICRFVCPSPSRFAYQRPQRGSLWQAGSAAWFPETGGPCTLFTSRPSKRTKQCPFRPEASSGWCRRRKRRAG